MTRKPLTHLPGTKPHKAQVEAANRIRPRYHALKAQGMDTYDAMLRARVEDAAAEWLATLPFGDPVPVEPGHLVLATYYHGTKYAEEAAYTYAVSQRWAPVFGMENFFDFGCLFAQCVSRKYYGLPSR